MIEWDGDTVCWIDVPRPAPVFPPTMMEDVMRLLYEVFGRHLDSRSLNVLLRTSKTLGGLVGGSLVQGLTLELRGNHERVSQLASSMRASQLRPVRMKLTSEDESFMTPFIIGVAPCLGRLQSMVLDPKCPNTCGEIGEVLKGHVHNLVELEINDDICHHTISVLAQISSLTKLCICVETIDALSTATSLSGVRELYINADCRQGDPDLQQQVAALPHLSNLVALDLGPVDLDQPTSHALLTHSHTLTSLRFDGFLPSDSIITVGPTLRQLTLGHPTLASLGRLQMPPPCALTVENDVDVSTVIAIGTQLITQVASAHFRNLVRVSLRCEQQNSHETDSVTAALAAGLSTGACATEELVLHDFVLGASSCTPLKAVLQAAPRLVKIQIMSCSVHPAVLSTAVHTAQRLDTMVLSNCSNIIPADIATLVGELYVLHMGAAFRFAIITDNAPLLESAVKVAKRRGWFDEEAVQREQHPALCLKFGV